MKCFFTNYHISVNRTLVDDLIAIGLEVVLPSSEFGHQHIDFFAWNDEHRNKKGTVIVNYAQFRVLEPMVILIPCVQLYDDFMKLYEERGRIDTLVYLSALPNTINTYPLHGTDYVISHDIIYHRATKAKYKIWYFNRPTVLQETKTEEEVRKTFNEKKVKLYINNLNQERFNPERDECEKFRDLWLKEYNYEMPFYGYGTKLGRPELIDTQSYMKDSMFTLVFKRPETWGQMVNESMLLGTPCIFLRKFMYSTFTQYLINEDTAIVGDNVKELVDKIKGMSIEQYETLSFEAKKQSEMFCNDINRREKLQWLFNKIKL